ncbi:MAG: hypothetical protein GTO60_01480, partial [Gammaproteobacteria bacterium]|nr:hypothetical protein [Gammaproteobacteria bacterium]
MASLLYTYYRDLNLPILRDYYLQQGDMAAARALYSTYYPELLDAARPVIGFRNYWAAVDLALVLQQTGETA